MKRHIIKGILLAQVLFLAFLSTTGLKFAFLPAAQQFGFSGYRSDLKEMQTEAAQTDDIQQILKSIEKSDSFIEDSARVIKVGESFYVYALAIGAENNETFPFLAIAKPSQEDQDKYTKELTNIKTKTGTLPVLIVGKVDKEAIPVALFSGLSANDNFYKIWEPYKFHGDGQVPSYVTEFLEKEQIAKLFEKHYQTKDIEIIADSLIKWQNEYYIYWAGLLVRQVLFALRHMLI
ncbi:MAG: hypothetical protein V2A72_07525 [Candidatus Omnitrophota bacterium]